MTAAAALFALQLERGCYSSRRSPFRHERVNSAAQDVVGRSSRMRGIEWQHLREGREANDCVVKLLEQPGGIALRHLSMRDQVTDVALECVADRRANAVPIGLG